MPAPTSSPAVGALTTGALTAFYYATPDLISSRTARGWVKAALTATSLAQSLPEIRSAWVAVRREVGGPLATAYDGLPSLGKAAVLGSGAVALGAAASGVLAAERWVHRRGEARATAGLRLPHTGPGLLYGALAAGLRLLPPASFDSGQPAVGTPRTERWFTPAMSAPLPGPEIDPDQPVPDDPAELLPDAPEPLPPPPIEATPDDPGGDPGGVPEPA